MYLQLLCIFLFSVFFDIYWLLNISINVKWTFFDGLMGFSLLFPYFWIYCISNFLFFRSQFGIMIQNNVPKGFFLIFTALIKINFKNRFLLFVKIVMYKSTIFFYFSLFFKVLFQNMGLIIKMERICFCLVAALLNRQHNFFLILFIHFRLLDEMILMRDKERRKNFQT